MILATPIPHNFFPSWEFVKCLLKASPHFNISYVEGPYIYDNRNRMIAFAKKHNESLLMVDSDIIFTLEDALKIRDHLSILPAVTGIYVVGENTPCIFKRIHNDYEYTEIPKKLERIGACGGGFLALSKELIQQLPDNPCDNVFESSMHGEDISLCHRINQISELWCDPTIRLGHLRSKILTCPQ